MKHVFADLHLYANPKDPHSTNQIISKAATLGYKLIAIQTAPEIKPEENQRLHTTCKTYGLDFVTRVDIRPRSPNDLLSQLRKLRRKNEIICVLCENKEVARQAAKDRRVDLLNFPQLDYRKRFFDHAEAELASSSQATIEVDIKPLLLLEGPSRIRLLSCLRRETAIAQNYHLPIVVSSGSSDPRLLRKPREMALVAALFGLEGPESLKAVSENASTIVTRNRRKLDKNFVAPGIRVVTQGEAF
jgi:RNase P/RNase MRP subunit p30